MRPMIRFSQLACGLALLALGAFTAACAGGRSAAIETAAAGALAQGGGQSIPFADLLALDYVHTVRMAPACELENPPRAMSSALGALPALPEAIPGARRASYDPADLTKDGAGFAGALPLANVAADGSSAAFTPTSTGEFDGLAYCVYSFPLDGYGANPDNLASIGFTWEDEPADSGNFYTGVADYAASRWVWYAGPGDRVLTLDGFDGMYYPGGELLVAVAITGTGETPALAEITIGMEEIRATGDETPDTPRPEVPPVADPAGGLPASCDLSAECSAVGDQRWWPSCTCFANGDSVFNFELGQVYGDCGWDLTNAFNRISPKHMYVISGEFQGIHPPGPPPLKGRYYDWNPMPLWDFGNATEWNVPYNMSYDKLWDAGAEADAALLRIDAFNYVPTDTADGITGAKTILAVQHKVLLMRTDLDSAFGHFEPGTVWEYTGPRTGGHAMAVVGYDDAKQAFKVRNSWGSDWGEDGYCWIGYDTFLNPEPFVVCWTIREDFDPAVAERFCGTQPPLPPPSGLSASDGRFYGDIRVSWNAVGAATGYRVYRDDPQSAPVAELGAELAWVDSGLGEESSHAYWVSAVNGGDESALAGPDYGFTLGTPARGDWYALGRDSRGSCQSLFTGPPLLPAQEAWRYQVEGSSSSSGFYPVVQGDGSILGIFTDMLICLDPDTGDERWSKTLPEDISGIVLGEDATIYVTTSGLGSGENKLRAFNYDGSDKWATASLGYDGLCAPVLGDDGTIYFGTDVQFGFNAYVMAYSDDGASAS
ncbi:MAG: PQQ-binding-like beta-propeller repeat protein, partial [Anaerolineae bacterium]|nr:PQQ-binding-like beta-propeller repeat protein [Anaerolineae bacterium]